MDTKPENQNTHAADTAPLSTWPASATETPPRPTRNFRRQLIAGLKWVAPPLAALIATYVLLYVKF